jgi:SAM-dependent methyltransferase
VSSGFGHITVVSGDPVKTNFPEGACDALFMRNVYHHFTEPGQINASIAASLKAGGRVAVVDFRPPGDEAKRPADRGKDGMHGVTPASVSRELKDAGFDVVATEDGNERWFMVVAAKPGS